MLLKCACKLEIYGRLIFDAIAEEAELVEVSYFPPALYFEIKGNQN